MWVAHKISWIEFLSAKNKINFSDQKHCIKGRSKWKLNTNELNFCAKNERRSVWNITAGKMKWVDRTWWWRYGMCVWGFIS